MDTQQEPQRIFVNSGKSIENISILNLDVCNVEDAIIDDQE